ncbi:GDYXXLXY domain-containing protein, partial [Serratia rubidaea]
MQTNSVIKWLTGALVLAALLLVNLSIYQKEQQLRQGRVAILQLAPVDPRSLMQGDYMALDYALAAPLRTQMRQQ